MTLKNVLNIKGLSVEFSTPLGSIRALKNIDLDVPRGSILGVVGESGCGKSTISNSILGLLANNARVRSGVIEFDGENLLNKSQRDLREIRGQKISVIFQDPMTTLNPVLSIGTQMTDILYRDAISMTEKRKRSVEILVRVGMPDPERRLDMYPHELSGGQRQRICIAMAVMMKPVLLIADEATTALDATLEREIIKLLKELQSELGCTMLFVTHHLGVVASLCDNVVVMHDGKIKEHGAVAEVFGNPQDNYTKTLLRCDPAWIKEKTRQLPIMTDDPNKPLTIDRGPEGRIKVLEAPILEISSLHVRFEKAPFLRGLLGGKSFRIDAVKDVALKLNRGETLAIVGESGSGKTTIARSIIGLQKVNSGTVHFNGLELTCLSNTEYKDIRREIAFMFQDPVGSLSPRMTVGSLLIEPFKIHKVVSSDYRGEAKRLLRLVGLDSSFLNRYPHELSGGQARRVGVARAIALEPKLIIADEPTAGLDVSIQGEVLNLLAEVQDRTSVAMLLITHNLNVVRHISDRVAIMYMGKFIEIDSTENIFETQKHNYTRRLIAASHHPDFTTSS